MLPILLVVGMILGLSAGTAFAERTPAHQNMSIASIHSDVNSSGEASSPSVAAGHSAATWVSTGTQATQPLDRDQEPESISRGSEP